MVSFFILKDDCWWYQLVVRQGGGSKARLLHSMETEWLHILLRHSVPVFQCNTVAHLHIRQATLLLFHTHCYTLPLCSATEHKYTLHHYAYLCRQCSAIGTTGFGKLDEFSKNSKRPMPPPPLFQKTMLFYPAKVSEYYQKLSYRTRFMTKMSIQNTN